MIDVSTAPLEVQLLIRSARAVLFDEEKETLPALAASIQEWPAALTFARYHRVVPLVAQAVLLQAARNVPERALADLQQNRFTFASHNLRLLQESYRLYTSLSREGIRVISFKGPLFAGRNYGNIGLRGSGDVDLIVSPEQLDAVEDVLAADGYFPYDRSHDRPQRAAVQKVEGQYPFIHPSQQWSLDLHTRLMPKGYTPVAGFDDLWAHTQEETECNLTMRTLSPRHMLPTLCLHGTKERWQELKYVCDVAAFVRAHPGIDWDEVYALARSARCLRILNLGLSLAHQLLGMSLPGDVVRRFHAVPEVQRLAAPIIADVLKKRTTFLVPRERLRYFFTVQDDFSSRLRYVSYVVRRRAGETRS